MNKTKFIKWIGVGVSAAAAAIFSEIMGQRERQEMVKAVLEEAAKQTANEAAK